MVKTSHTSCSILEELPKYIVISLDQRSISAIAEVILEQYAHLYAQEHLTLRTELEMLCQGVLTLRQNQAAQPAKKAQLKKEQIRLEFILPKVAQNLPEWSLRQATSYPLEEVLRIVNEFSRQTLKKPVTKALHLGTVVRLANHTIPQARDSREIPIEDSAASIRSHQSLISKSKVLNRCRGE